MEIDSLQSDVQALNHCVQDIEEFIKGVQKEQSIDIGLMAELEKEWNGAYQMITTTTNHGISRLDRQIVGVRAEMMVVNKELAMSTSRLAGVDNRATTQQKEKRIGATGKNDQRTQGNGHEIPAPTLGHQKSLGKANRTHLGAQRDG